MDIQELIIKKRDGQEFTREEIEFWVDGISDGTIPDYQLAAWLMAVYFRGMTAAEIRHLSWAMAYSGEVADLSAVEGVTVDKHSTGGVGDKTTLVVVPLVAAAGVPIAKMSGRGLGHTGGTIDKLEAIPGFQVEMPRSRFIEQVNRVKAAVISQSGNLVPADKRLYAIRDVTGTVESIPLIASSIMSKKIASGARGIVLDVKVGSGAFMKNKEEALELAKDMVNIGQEADRQVVAVLSNMYQPLGRMVGNSLEVREAIAALWGEGPSDLEEISVVLASYMLVLGGKHADVNLAAGEVRQLLKSGRGLDKFKEIVEAQGGRLDYDMPSGGMPQARFEAALRVNRSGYVTALDAEEVGRAAMLAGAGRERLGDNIDYTAGVKLIRKYGDYVEKGDAVAMIYGNNEARIETARKRLAQAYRFGDQPPQAVPLLIDTIK